MSYLFGNRTRIAALEKAYQKLIIKQERLNKCLQGNLKMRKDLKVIDVETVEAIQVLLSDSEDEPADSGDDDSVAGNWLKDVDFSGQCSYILLVSQNEMSSSM